MVSIGRTYRHWLHVTALGLTAYLTLGAAPVSPPGKPQGAPKAAPAPAENKSPDQRGLSAYDREALAVDRVANGIAERANLIAEAQRSYAFWQLALGFFGVFFTGVAAFFAWRATHWAKEATKAARASAEADNDSLRLTREGLKEAREGAALEAQRFSEQISTAERMATASVSAATATRRLVGATTESAQAAHAAVRVSEQANAAMLRPYVYITDERISVATFYVNKLFVTDDAPIGFSIKNFGQTPAKRVRLKVRAFIAKNSITNGDPLTFEYQPTLNQIDLPPSSDRKINGYGIKGMEQGYAAIYSGESAVFFDGLIEYEGASGAKYETRFRRSCSGKDIETGVFTVTENGNEAT